MRKILFLLLTMIGATNIYAGDYAYLTFETTDGGKVSVSAWSQTLTISGNTLSIGGHSFTLSNLNKMYFSASDETTGIRTLSADDWNNVTDIYDMKGNKVSKSQMQKGIYIVRTSQGTFKVTAK